VPPRPLEEVVLRLGFEEVRSTGVIAGTGTATEEGLRYPSTQAMCPRTLRGVLKQLRITRQEFNRILRGR